MHYQLTSYTAFCTAIDEQNRPLPHTSISHGLPQDVNRLCNCGQRFVCSTCRRSRIRRLVRTHAKPIELSGIPWAVLLTVAGTGDYLRDVNEMFQRWSLLGRQRSRQLRKIRRTGPLAQVQYGVAGVHFYTPRGLRPHLHAVLAMVDRLDVGLLSDHWGDWCNGSEVRTTVERSLAYAFGGWIPDDSARQQLQRVFHGRQLVRRIGRARS